MNKELKYLIDILREAQLKAEAAELMHLLIKSAEIYDVNLQSWQAVITELDKPYDTQIQGKAILYIAEAIKNLAKMAVKDLSKIHSLVSDLFKIIGDRSI